MIHILPLVELALGLWMVGLAVVIQTHTTMMAIMGRIVPTILAVLVVIDALARLHILQGVL